MKKATTTEAKKATQTTEVQNTTIKATKANIKKEDKNMTTATKKADATTITIPESLDQNILKAYKVNEANELLMTDEMLTEFLEANPTLVAGKKAADPTSRGICLKGTKKAFVVVRIDETAKKKQVHIKTGATKKVCSARNEADGMRYKVIFVQAKNRFELWSAGNDGKRKKMAQGAEAEVMALYNKAVGIETEATEVKAQKSTRTSKKATKKSA